jgi:hypothetical protein
MKNSNSPLAPHLQNLPEIWERFALTIRELEASKLALERHEIIQIFQAHDDVDFRSSFLENFGFEHNDPEAQGVFETRIIGAFKRMPKPELEVFIKYLSRQLYFSGKGFTLKIEPSRSELALQWTQLYIYLLGIFDEPTLQAMNIEIVLPFYQCYWCGQNKEWKHKHDRFCHSFECKAENHVNCCQDEWYRLKTRTKKRFKEVPLRKRKNSPVEIFESFLNEVFMRYYNGNYPPIRTEEDKRLEGLFTSLRLDSND